MNDTARVLQIGIASREAIKARTMAIAAGRYKPKPNEPKVWFTSIESLAQVLSSKNALLLEMIAKAKPASMKELANLSGREVSNLSRTLATMKRYGLVDIKQVGSRRVPEVQFDRVNLDMSLTSEILLTALIEGKTLELC